MDFADGDRTPDLSTEAQDLYDAIAGRNWELVDTIQTQHPNARPELLAWNLITNEHRPLALNPQPAFRAMVSRQLAAAVRHIDLVSTMPELSRGLIRSYQQVQLGAGGSSVYLADQDTVNARLQEVVGEARREILAAQPAGPRKREVLEQALPRDAAALDRGVKMRTIYLDSVREHPITAEYARTLSARVEGRPAKYATLVGDFERMILVDRETAFLTNHIVVGAEHSAWMVTDPAVVAVLAKVFEAQWRRAEPWTGELRARNGGVDTVSCAGGVRTDRRQRAILRLLCAGKSQEVTARKMDVSRRKLQEEIAEMKARWGVSTLNELIFQWALSPDRLVDDSAPAEDDRVAVTTAGAEKAEQAA